MQARQVMTQPVVTVNSSDTVEQAISLMLAKGISGLPVINAAGALVGMLTEGDLLRRAELGTERSRPRWLEFLVGPGKLADEYVHTHGRTVADVMSNDVIDASVDATLEEIVTSMEKEHIKRIPILDGGKLVGIVSRSNLLRALIGCQPLSGTAADSAPAQAPHQAITDDAIKARLWAELQGTKWAPCFSVTLEVHDGIVELNGSITDGREREALRVAATNTPGVKRVNDHLVWIDPTSGTLIEPGS